MPIISLDSNDSMPLIDQVVNALQKMIVGRAFRAGARMPSIRNFAQDHGISRFTVVQAYDRLVAMGYMHSRQGAGFYVSARPKPHNELDGTYKPDSAVDVVWLLRNSLEHRSSKTMPGHGGFQPPGWKTQASKRVCGRCR